MRRFLMPICWIMWELFQIGVMWAAHNTTVVVMV